MERRFALIKHTHFLSDLADFSVSSPADGDVLEYDSSTSKWVNVTVASLGGLAEAVQDLAGAALTDTTSVNFTYTDGTGRITADVLPAGVDHNSLLNYVADQHVAHSGVTMTAGAGLTGGGDISATRTFAVGAGTGITVNADDVALSAASIASLLLADNSTQKTSPGFPSFNNSVLAGDIRNLTNPSTGIGYPMGVRFRFSSLNDDSTSPYADVIDMATYGDSSGGGYNSLYFGKGSQTIRHKYAAAGGTSWTTKTIAYTDTFSGANPTASVGLSAVNGSATTFLRSDGAPALSQAIVPTWTGVHTFSAQSLFASASAAAPSVSFDGDTDTGLYRHSANILGASAGGALKAAVTSGPEAVALCSNGANGDVYLSFYESNALGARKGYVGFPNAGNDNMAVWNQEDAGVYIGTNNTSRGVFAANGQFLMVPLSSASTPDIAGNSDTNTGIYWPAADQLGFSEGGTGYMVGFREVPRVTSYTATRLGSVGRCMAISAGITINTGIYNAGDAFSVYNDSASAITLTQGASVTMRLGGTTTTGSRTLAARGVATLWFNSASEPIVSGPGVT